MESITIKIGKSVIFQINRFQLLIGSQINELKFVVFEGECLELLHIADIYTCQVKIREIQVEQFTLGRKIDLMKGVFSKIKRYQMSVVVEIYCNYFVGVEIEMLQVFKMIDVNCVDFIEFNPVWMSEC